MYPRVDHDYKQARLQAVVGQYKQPYLNNITRISKIKAKPVGMH